MWFTLEDAAEKLGVSIDTVHEVLGISMIQILEYRTNNHYSYYISVPHINPIIQNMSNVGNCILMELANLNSRSFTYVI